MKAHQVVTFVDILASSGLGSPPNYHPHLSNEAVLLDLLETLNDDEVDFVLKLLPHYKIYHDYRKYAYDLLNMIVSNYTGDIYLTPVIDINDPEKIKSGSHIFYEFRTLAEAYFSGAFKFLDQINASNAPNPNCKVFAVDDFVGSGTQFLDMVTDLKAKIPTANVTGLCVPVIMRTGYDAIKAVGIDVLSSEIKEKALDVTLRAMGSDVNALYKVNENVENRMNISSFISCGFEKSESLLSMKKTPDNTFPIFWYRGDNLKWPSPFPR